MKRFIHIVLHNLLGEIVRENEVFKTEIFEIITYFKIKVAYRACKRYRRRRCDVNIRQDCYMYVCGRDGAASNIKRRGSPARTAWEKISSPLLPLSDERGRRGKVSICFHSSRWTVAHRPFHRPRLYS